MITLFASYLARFVASAAGKPVTTATAGAATAGSALYVVWVERLTLALQLGAVAFGCLSGAIAILLVLPRLLRFIRAWRARGLLEADRDPPTLD